MPLFGKGDKGFTLISVEGFVNAFVGYFRGIGQVKIPVIGTILHMTLRVLCAPYLVQKMGLTGIALATGIGWMSVVLFQLSCYKVNSVLKLIRIVQLFKKHSCYNKGEKITYK